MQRMRWLVRLSLLAAAALASYAWKSGKLPSELPEQPAAEAVQQPADVAKPLTAAPIKGEKMLKREGYIASYNTLQKQPNYVAWVLTPTRIKGTAKRCSTFFQDPELADNERSTLDDYRSSGYDRGHMCPAGDNKWSSTAMIESFYLSNVCPQKHTLNSGDWRLLEEACRRWVGKNKQEIHIICGPVFKGHNRKLHKRVGIPDYFFKTLLCLEKGQEKGIAFIFSNDTSDQPMEQHVCTIDSIERLTGYDLYDALDSSLQKRLESRSRLQDWNL